MKVYYEMSCTLFSSSSLCTWHITLTSFFVMSVCWWSTKMVVPAWLLCLTCMYFPFKKYEWPFYLGVLCLNHQLIIYFYRIIVIILNGPLIDWMQVCYLQVYFTLCNKCFWYVCFFSWKNCLKSSWEIKCIERDLAF